MKKITGFRAKTNIPGFEDCRIIGIDKENKAWGSLSKISKPLFLVHPIIFSTPMVQAILDGRKTMTRRAVKPQPLDGLYYMKNAPLDWHGDWKPWKGETEQGESIARVCPFGEYGDLLWVRETWQEYGGKIFYKADGEKNEGPLGCANKWKPSIHIKKVDARIWLELIEVRVERLHDITDSDAIAEGVEMFSPSFQDFGHNKIEPERPKELFESLWNKINGNWNENPWVWVISFKRVDRG